MSGSDIFRIFPAPSTQGKDPVWDKLGICEVVDKYSLYISESAAELALQAAQSSTPIKTGELRQNILKLNSGNAITITISDSLHVTSTGKNKPTNVQLADILNDSDAYKRSRASVATAIFNALSAGDPTSAWIDIAQSKFDTAIQGLK
jgi:hypothetical protein